MALVHGNEEIESVTISNILIRAGNSVTIAKINLESELKKNKMITLTRGLKIVKEANSYLDEEKHENYDMMVLTGGILGAKNYNKSPLLKKILQERIKQRLRYGAICATPGMYLAPNKLLLSKGTCYPTFKSQILQNGYQYEDQPYIVDEHCITGRGPADAMQYALKLVELLNGKSKLEEVKSSILFRY